MITSVLFNIGDESKLLKQMLHGHLPEEGHFETLKKPVDLQWALGSAIDGPFYKYDGNYAASPTKCLNGVKWVVFENPMTMSSEQWSAFKAAYPNPGNNRPIQPLGNREVVKNTLQEPAAVDYKFFLNREMGRDKRETPIAYIAFPICGTLLLCSVMMVAIFQREDLSRRSVSAGGLKQEPHTIGK